jgi:hypothetical protein
MQLVIQTQVYENYGSAVTPYWKAKGGSIVRLTDVPLNIDYQAAVKAANIEIDNPMLREYIIDWSLEGDDFMSESEKNQLEYEGKIVYPDARIEYSELVETV